MVSTSLSFAGSIKLLKNIHYFQHFYIDNLYNIDEIRNRNWDAGDTSMMLRKKPKSGKAAEAATAIFLKHGGIMRTSEAIKAGINAWTLYEMRDRGEIEALSRGVYRLTSAEPVNTPDILSVLKRVPTGVICLISALQLHNMTLQIPHYVYIAIDFSYNRRDPSIKNPPTKTFRFVSKVFEPGQEIMEVDGFKIRVYSPEKTIADCFKHRNKIGLDVAIEALKMYRERKKVRVDKLLEYARICRVEKIIKPYLEAIL